MSQLRTQIIPETKKRKRSSKKKPPAGSQVLLTTGKTVRQSKRSERAKQQIEQLRASLELAQLLASDGEEADTLRMEWALHMERNGDARLTWASWWLGFDLDLDAPARADYKFGSYWTGSEEDVKRYVRDRAEWALPILEEEMKAAEETLEALETPVFDITKVV